MKPKRTIGPIISLAVVGLLLLGWFNRYNLWDWYRLRGYQPPARIVQLAEETAMTDYGRRLFYVNHPELNDKAAFNQNCTISEQSIVLGCYVSGEGIFIYDVADKRLQGVHHVTAAHEMLHAAYDRLSDSEKKRVDDLTARFSGTLNDERLKQTIEAYRQRDPDVVPNELHSILATEVEVLPGELEDYYKRHFTSRQAVVAYSRQYETAFSERERQIEAYDTRLGELRGQIEQLEIGLEAREAELLSDRERLDALLAAQRYSEYNASVPGFNASVRAYNADVGRVRSLIEEFNRIVAARNEIALEENELVKAIDSRPDTIPQE